MVIFFAEDWFMLYNWCEDGTLHNKTRILNVRFSSRLVVCIDSRGVTVVEGILFVVLWQLILEVLQWWRGYFLLYYGSWFSRCYSGVGDTFCCIMAADSRGVTVVEGILFVVLWQLILEVLQWWRGYFLLYYGSWFSRCYSGGGDTFCCIMAADSRGVTVVEGILFVVLWQLILEVLQWWRGYFFREDSL